MTDINKEFEWMLHCAYDKVVADGYVKVTAAYYDMAQLTGLSTRTIMRWMKKNKMKFKVVK